MGQRLSAPRVAPLELDQVDAETHALLEGTLRRGSPSRIFATLAHHPKLLKRWMVFGRHILEKSTLPPRERELVVLRIGWLCRSSYEFSAHVPIGKAAGLSDADIERLKQGPDAPGLDPFDRVLLQAVQELEDDAFVTDATWQALSERLDVQQCMDLIFTVGQYRMVSMALNSLGVQPERPVVDFS